MIKSSCNVSLWETVLYLRTNFEKFPTAFLNRKSEYFINIVYRKCIQRISLTIKQRDLKSLKSTKEATETLPNNLAH